MAFIPETLSIFYDSQHDRLNLLFINKDKQQLMGVMTRRFFKNLLVHLPEWLASQASTVQAKASQNQPQIQQKTVSQFNHKEAQHSVKNKQTELILNDDVARFVVGSINFAMIAREKSQDGIQLEFLSLDNQHQATLSIDLPKLHKLIGEVLTKADDWDLANPWQVGDFTVVVPTDAANMVH